MIYFAQAGDGGPIKIGFTGSTDVRKRIGLIQTGCPQRITILGISDGDEQEESRLHGRFSALRLRGEWFRPDAELLSEIATNARPLAGGCWRKPKVERCPNFIEVGPDLKTVAEIVGTFGGPSKVARMTGATPSNVSNWIAKNRIVPKYTDLFCKALNRLGKRAPIRLLGQLVPDGEDWWTDDVVGSR